MRETQRYAEIGWFVIGLAVLAIVFLLTRTAFNRVLEAIAVLEKMGEGDLSATITSKSGLFSSRRDEVGRLIRAIENYRAHRLESEEQRIERGKRRNERDEIMFQMALYRRAEIYRAMLLGTGPTTRGELNAGDEESREKASIEMMSRAFSSMSDEVVVDSLN